MRGKRKIFFLIKGNAGQSLIQTIVSMAILAIVISGTASYMVAQAREVRALAQQLAKLDLEKYLIASLADGSICTAELSQAALNPLAPYSVNDTNEETLAATTIELNEGLHASSVAGSPLLLKSGGAASSMAPDMLVDKITVDRFQRTGVADRYVAQMKVSFKGSMVRSLSPIVLQKTIVTSSSDPASAKRITGCLGSGGSQPMPLACKIKHGQGKIMCAADEFIIAGGCAGGAMGATTLFESFIDKDGWPFSNQQQGAMSLVGWPTAQREARGYSCLLYGSDHSGMGGMMMAGSVEGYATCCKKNE